ncbi:nhr-80 [Pristionchus pacificus]|uniref:Nhr-80 n=1 Tax=Pristionchus pacificus TaxID=54126 RepID=A0A2A6B9Y2_PRIPA|nr:nhr-80 [Pristionchus pacificus]|eukprot:PDM62661.1 nhr-80 [Pristionchus pacificus]
MPISISSPPAPLSPINIKHSPKSSKPSPELPDVTTRCLICHAQATGFHFEAQSCSACAAFFRRTVALSKEFACINSKNECTVHYSMHQICRACRYAACMKAGMDKSSVQPRRGNGGQKRAFCTKSGLKRNKRFAIVAKPKDDDETYIAATVLATITNECTKQGPHSVASTSHSPSPSLHAASPPDQKPTMIIRPQPVKSEECQTSPVPPFTRTTPTPPDEPKFAIPKHNALDILIREEMKLGERRRIVFCERPVAQMLGVNKNCPFTREDIKPLSFRAFRKQIRTHILFIYEWLQSWPDYATLDNADRVSILRSCVLLHTILDPIYITLQIGLPDRFVMQNGGYISCIGGGEGWGDEEEITEKTKRHIYEPLLKKIMAEIIPPMLELGMSFEEFVALKALVSFQGAIPNVSQRGQEAMRKQLNAVTATLHSHLVKNNLDAAQRLGELILLLSAIFSTGLEFVESHRQIQFFDLWQLDSLLLQLLNLDAILAATKDF